MMELIESADGTPWAILVALVCTPYGWPLAFAAGWLVKDWWSSRKERTDG